MSRTAKPAKRAGARVRLRRVLRDEVEGKRTCVLVLGDGLNRQAERQNPDRPSDWQRVLRTIWLEAGGAARNVPPAGQSAAATWAMLVAQWAAHHRHSAKRAETEVRRRICALFAPIETAVRRRPLYATLLDGRLANLITFSLDRRLVLQSGARRAAARHVRASFLQRHFEVSGARGKTRVWFPYGHTGHASSIDPGSSTFDTRLMELERNRATLYEHRWHAPATWSELFLCAPLVIVGASLPTDDWPLWWLLHQRARYFVAFKEREIAETFCLTSRLGDAEHVINGAAGLETVRFANDEELWRFVLSALDAPGVDHHPGFMRRFKPRSRNRASRSKRRTRKRAAR